MWEIRYRPPSSTNLLAVTFGDGQFVAVGTAGAILTSTNGADWFPQASGTASTLLAVTHGKGTFVAVGHAGVIVSSIDGTNWTLCASPTNTTYLMDVAYDHGRFVAVGWYGVVVTSDDGVAWALQSAGVNWNLYDLTGGNGLFLLPVGRGTNLVSSDGVSWSPRPSGTDQGLYLIGFGDNTFVAIDTAHRAFTSPDGSNWTQRGSVQMYRPGGLAHGHGHWVVVGPLPLEYSEDATSWRVSTNASVAYASDVAFGHSTFVALGSKGICQSQPIVRLETASPGRLSLVGPPGRLFEIEALDDFQPGSTWRVLTNVVIPVSPFPWEDLTPAGAGQRFYRAILLP